MKFGKEELKKGTYREMEHTDSRKEAAKIAKDHLKEKPDYYTKLDKCIPEENIQELSQDTLKSYKKKATNDASSAYKATHAAFDNDDEAGAKKNDRDWRKRSKGLKMVDKKIVKEENIQELSDKTLKSYSQKAYDDFLDHDSEDKKNPKWAENRINGSKKADKIVSSRAGQKNWDKLKKIKEGVNGEHGPGDDEDSLDRIERKAQEKSRKAAAKVRAIKKAAAEKKNV